MVTLINGDILNISMDNAVICHQVNCQGKMGTGIALKIRQRFPKVYEQYIKDYECGRLRLGNVRMVWVGGTKFVANLCGQDRYGRDRRYTDYEALQACLTKIYRLAFSRKLKVLIPFGMGCNNAGGDWRVVYQMIQETFSDEVEVYIVKYEEE